MAGKAVPVTGDVLSWAMADAGISRQHLAEILKTPPNTIERWEQNRDHPTLTQFHALAKTLGRPESFFLLPRPPSKPPVAAAFRKFSPIGQSITPDETKYVRLAHQIQSVANWVHKRIDPDVAIHVPHANINSNVEAAAETIGSWLDWSIEDQIGENATETSVTNAMRGRLQDWGIIVLHLSLSEHGVRGFSLPGNPVPLIAVSTKDIKPARLFSYVHETAHLLARDESFCLTRQDTGAERWCNQVAGALLMPLDDFREHVRSKIGNALVYH